MNNLTYINIQELIYNLDHLPDGRNLLLFGDHGIGKSQIVADYYEKKGYKVVPLFLGQMSDPGDLTGLPYKKKVVVRGVEVEKMDFLPPIWWDEEKPFCLFLDEINRGRQEILNVVMDLTLNRKLAGRELPKGSVIVAAANIGEQYAVNDMDKALLDRFVPFMFRPTVEEWIQWGTKTNLDERVIGFISNNPEMLDSKKKEGEGEDMVDVTPSRRSWVGVSQFLSKVPGRLGSNDFKFISGFVGPDAASLFNSYVNSKAQIDIKELLLGDFEKEAKGLKKMETVELIRVIDQVTAYTLKDDLTKDQKSKICVNFFSLLEWLKNGKKSEVIAYIMPFFLKPECWLSLDKKIQKFALEHLKNTKTLA